MSVLVELPLASYPTTFPDVGIGGAFSRGAARLACWAAQLAYESDAVKIETIARGWNFQVQMFERLVSSPLPVTDTKGVVLTNDSTTILSFAGTDPLSLANWISDFNFIPRSGDLHTGFRLAADAAWPDALAAAQQTAAPKSLVITGHSLGAAIAVLTANRLQHEGIRVADAIYLFGAPRAGGVGLIAEYGDTLGSRTYRLAHGGDIVPTVPPAPTFRHVGRYLHCDRYTKFANSVAADTASNEPGFGTTLLADLRTSVASLFAGHALVDPKAEANGLIFPALPPAVGDHLPDRYLLALS